MPVKLKRLTYYLRREGPLAAVLPVVGVLVLAGLFLHTLNGRLRPVLEAVARQLAALDSESLGVPLGTLTGQPLLSGAGPRVRVSVDSVGEVTADYANSFTSAGVNQTLHRVCLDIHATVRLFLPGEVLPVSVSSSVCVAETVIVGETPDTYLNLDKGDG